MKNSVSIVIIAGILNLVFISAATAAKKPIRFGFGIGYGEYTVSDPDADTNSATTPYFSGLMTIPLSKNYPLWRYSFDLNYKKFDLEYGNNVMGQSVSSLSLGVIPQRAFKVSKYVIPYLGMGFGLSFEEFKNRSTGDEDNFLKASYPDRDEVLVNFILNAGLISKSFSGYSVGGGVSYTTPLGDGISGFSAQAYFLF